MGDNEDDNVIGYVKEPPRFMKLRMMDKGLTAPISAAAEVYEAVLIKEASDHRCYSEDQKYDKYYMGGSMVVYDSVQMAVDQFKKK